MKRIRDTLARANRSGGFYAWFPILLLIFSLYLAYLVVRPFLHAVILALVLAAIFNPINEWLNRFVANRRGFSSGITVALIVVVICIPAFLFITGLAGQGTQSLARFNAWLMESDFKSFLQDYNLAPALDWLHQKMPFLDTSKLDIQTKIIDFSQSLGRDLITMGTNLIGNLVILSIQFLLMLVILFYLFKDGPLWLENVKYLLPLRRDQADAVLDSLRRVSRAVLVGGLLVATLQGIVGGFALYLVGIKPLFWGSMIALASLVPFIGTGMIWIPIAITMVFNGEWQPALFLAAWFIIIVVQIDTFLRPVFMKESAGLPVFFIFLSVIGGVQAFGAGGIIYGPLVLSFVTAMVRIYGREYGHILDGDLEEPETPLEEELEEAGENGEMEENEAKA
ncbi:AI-2E family transporter [Desulfohalovibrio reitneri]|uniref:AI-2E family transporter n=1 Tax=Desulfohalovibrio reitneri TaxID=1307759 RepID=UPI000690438F|nr:AI-2E family transporter [Desulfohalovibrio reitneri]